MTSLSRGRCAVKHEPAPSGAQCRGGRISIRAYCTSPLSFVMREFLCNPENTPAVSESSLQSYSTTNARKAFGCLPSSRWLLRKASSIIFNNRSTRGPAASTGTGLRETAAAAASSSWPPYAHHCTSPLSFVMSQGWGLFRENSVRLSIQTSRGY